MRIMLLETLLAQLFGDCHKDGFTEMFRSELANKSQACRCKKHLLAHACSIGDVGDGEEFGCRVVAA